ncbi:MAG: cupin domain-containing protein [Spirochaetia bacterium]|jgi:quercetin dioxygenase-like cupin family protein|nr:cupin domain-containing protein [Spirochaetia bacterium]
MDIVDYTQLQGMEFPTGRKTQVYIGKNAPVAAKSFCQGLVTIYPDGSVPEHTHDNEETYTILSGSGEMTVGDEVRRVHGGECIYIPSGKAHGLKNVSSEENLVMMFVYAPATIVDHWAQELAAGK